MMAATVSGVGLATTPIFSLAVNRISGTAITDISAVSLIMAMNSLVRGGITSLHGLGEDDEAHGLARGHAQGPGGLRLTLRDGLDAGPEDLRGIGSVAQRRAEDAGHQRGEPEPGDGQAGVDEDQQQQQRQPAEEVDVGARRGT